MKTLLQQELGGDGGTKKAAGLTKRTCQIHAQITNKRTGNLWVTVVLTAIKWKWVTIAGDDVGGTKTPNTNGGILGGISLAEVPNKVLETRKMKD